MRVTIVILVVICLEIGGALLGKSEGGGSHFYWRWKERWRADSVGMHYNSQVLKSKCEDWKGYKYKKHLKLGDCAYYYYYVDSMVFIVRFDAVVYKNQHRCQLGLH